MKVLNAVVPVMVMLAMGKLFALKHIISKETVKGMKDLVSGILLPVVIFNALLTASFSARSLILSMLVYVLFAAGFMIAVKLIRPRMKHPMSHFLMLGCEGGMIGYSLYTSLYGADALSTLMEIDLGNILFAFTIFIVTIKIANSESGDTKAVILDSLKTPLVIVVVLALALNFTGFGKMLLSSPVGGLYSSVVNMITSPVSAMILLSVGYELQFDASMMKDVVKVSGIRLILNGLIAAIILTVGKSLINSDMLFTAVILYAVLPPQFITPIFIKDEKESSFAATTLSFHTLVTIAAYIAIAASI